MAYRELLLRVHLDYRPRKHLRHGERRELRDAARTRTGECRTSSGSPSCATTSSRPRRAIDGGVPLAGYFVWSLMDNFEWDRGYSQRFGIVWVDYGPSSASPKDSALWYQRVISENAVPVA